MVYTKTSSSTKDKFVHKKGIAATKAKHPLTLASHPKFPLAAAGISMGSTLTGGGGGGGGGGAAGGRGKKKLEEEKVGRKKVKLHKDIDGMSLSRTQYENLSIQKRGFAIEQILNYTGYKFLINEEVLTALYQAKRSAKERSSYQLITKINSDPTIATIENSILIGRSLVSTIYNKLIPANEHMLVLNYIKSLKSIQECAVIFGLLASKQYNNTDILSDENWPNLHGVLDRKLLEVSLGAPTPHKALDDIGLLSGRSEAGATLAATATEALLALGSSSFPSSQVPHAFETSMDFMPLTGGGGESAGAAATATEVTTGGGGESAISMGILPAEAVVVEGSSGGPDAPPKPSPYKPSIDTPNKPHQRM